MDCYSDHSAILDYLAEVEQEKQLRESLKSKSGIAALRVERGAGPYKQWEKQPLFDDHGEASSTSANEEEDLRKEHGSDRIVSKRTMQYLIWFNCALFLLVVGGFTLLGSHSNTASRTGGSMPEPPGSLIRHNALVGLHSHPIAPAPALAHLYGPVSTPHIAPAPALAAAAPGHGPAPTLHAGRDRYGSGKVAGGFAQRQADPVASSGASAALAAAQYWKGQQEEFTQEANDEWQDGDLSWDEPAVANAPAAAWYWRNRVSAPASGPQPHVPAPAPTYAHMAGANKQMPSWAHQASYFASAAQGQQNVPVEPDSNQKSTGSKPWQNSQSNAYTSDWDERQYEPATSSATPAQHSGFPVTDIEDVPSQAALAARIYGENPALPEKGAYGAQTPVPKKSGILSKFAPFHAAAKLPSSARPAQASGATYLTPSEVQAIGAKKNQADTEDLHEDGFLDAQRDPWP